MRRVKPTYLLWGAMTVGVCLASGCSTTAYQDYLVAKAEYDQCVKQAGNSRAHCVSERERLSGAAGSYEQEAERNQWWRSPLEDVRKQEPLSVYDRK